MDFLTEMMHMQYNLQSKINGYNIVNQTDEQRIENIAYNVLALTDELHEALGEVGWKKWATSRHINEEQLKGELIDAWHFLMNLFLHAGMSAEDVYDRYAAKWRINHQRQDDKYDGVSTKCRMCDRALDDPANIIRTESRSALIPNVTYHCVCGQFLQNSPIPTA